MKKILSIFSKRNLKRGVIVILIILAILIALSIRKTPEKVDYGVSFSAFHSRELNLDWKTVYDSILNDLGVRRFRFSAHWPITEPQKDKFNWTELDYQMKEAERVGAEVILTVGRRLPGWPECHEPEWAYNLSKADKQKEILEYISATVNRYKGFKSISYWQVENEPFLSFFARHHCGDFLDKDFIKKEIALVKSLDPNRTILVTDSGELGLWYNAYQLGDSFGTSLYLYVWNHTIGPVRYPIPPQFFKIKRNLVELVFGKKEVLLIELSAEPWLLNPIIDTPFDIALSRMDINKFNNILKFAQKAGFEKQYLWGAEWWYFMRENNHPEFWERAREVLKK